MRARREAAQAAQAPKQDAPLAETTAAAETEAARREAIASGVIPPAAAVAPHPASMTPATDDVESECLICESLPCRCAEIVAAEAAKGLGNVVPLRPTVSRVAASPDPLPWAKVCFSAFYARDPDAGPHDVERHAQAADRVKKGYGLDADGRPVKVQPKGFWYGEAHRHTIGLDQLHEALARNKRSDLALLTAGVYEQDRITLPYAAQRAKDELPFPVAAGLLTIDSDELESWPGLATPADVVQVLAALGLDADCITSPSSSSYLQWPTGSYGLRGLHTFFAIDSGAEIPRVLDVLFRRAWLTGHGRILISGSGVMLERSIVDRALASGNQPLFERGAVLKDVRITQPRLVEKRRGRQRQVRAADILPLTETEEREYAERVQAAKGLLVGDAAQTRREWAERLAAHLPEDKRAERVAQLSDLAEKKHRDLPPDFRVTLNDGGVITVAEIVARRDEFDRRGIRDPFEPEYGANKATIFTKGQTDGRVKILSRAHGLDVTYYLEPKPADLSAFDEFGDSTLEQGFDGDFSYAEPIAIAPGALVWRSQDGKRGRDVASKARDKILPSLRGRVAWAREAAMWHVWNGTCWTPQGDGAVAHKRLHDGVEIGCSDLGFNPDYVMSIEKLLRMGDCLPLPEWDDGQQIPFRNGVLNLHTRELTASNPQHGNTWALPYDYTPDATCPRISDWLREAMGGDDAMVAYVYAALAAILTGRSDLQIFFYLFGPGGTGKSTFLRLATALVGQSNTYTTTLKALEEGQFETACLYGMRLVVINDAGKYGKAVDNLKAATGEDWLRNERKHVQQSQRSQFIYRGMVLIASNVRFTSTDQTSGIERRQRSIDMENVVSEAQKAAWREQGGEEAVLHAEIPGLVNRLLKMPREEVARILNNPPRKAARSDFEALLANNHVARWMVGCCAPDPKHHGVIGQSRELRAEGGRLVQEHKELHLYPSFLMFCAEERIQPLSRSRFKATVLDMARSLGHPVENKPAPGLNVDSFRGIRLLGQYESRYRWHESIRDEEIEVPPNPFD